MHALGASFYAGTSSGLTVHPGLLLWKEHAELLASEGEIARYVTARDEAYRVPCGEIW